MKRYLIYIALSLCLLLSGCGKQEQPAHVPVQPDDAGTVQPAPAGEHQSGPVADRPEPAQPPQEEPPYEMAAGVWLALTDAGYSNYYYFDPENRSGSYVSLEYGLGMSFVYDGAGEELTFRLEDHEEEKSAVVEHLDSGSFVLNWADSLPETLTFVGEGTLEDYPFYSNAELGEMAIDHYAVHNGVAEEEMEGLTDGTMTNVDNTVTVQLYRNLGDHNSNAAWYVVNRFTAIGTDLTSGEEINLLDCRMAEPEEEQEDAVRYFVSEPEKVAALIELFRNDQQTVDTHGGDNLVDWLTNSTHSFTLEYGDPYWNYHVQPMVGWYIKAVDAGSFFPITVPDHLLEEVLTICGVPEAEPDPEPEVETEPEAE